MIKFIKKLFSRNKPPAPTPKKFIVAIKGEYRFIHEIIPKKAPTGEFSIWYTERLVQSTKYPLKTSSWQFVKNTMYLDENLARQVFDYTSK